jgi:hypothetical protein
MRRTIVVSLLALIALVPASPASARSAVRVGLADQSPAMFDNPYFQQLKIKRTRYFVPSDVMQDATERAKASAFVVAARRAGVSVLLHISTTDLRKKRGPVVSTAKYRRDVGRIVAHFRPLGVRDFGAWNEVNHASQETYNRVGNAVSYFKSMYSAVRRRCQTCAVVGLDVLDQVGVDRYIRRFYARLSRTWRTRLKVVGIHNYSDVNRNRSTGTRKVITTARRYNRRVKFWFTETGGVVSFGGAFPYHEARQASRIKNMFSFASRYRTRGVQRVYSYNFFAVATPACGSCPFDAGLLRVDGTPRPVFAIFKQKLASYSR